jgi:tetratricopeptide (TPR) repeat protein
MVELKAPTLDSISFKTKKHPKDVLAQVRLARDMAARADTDAALRVIEDALGRQSNDPDLLEGKGLLLLKLNRPEEALASLDGAVRAGNQDATVHIGRGVALHALQRLNESLAAFNRALILRQDNNVLAMKRAVLKELLWSLVEEGFASWSGGKPKGSKRPIRVTPGPPISDYIVQDRERLRD